MIRSLYRRAGIGLGKAIGAAICEPQVRLGRRCHDGTCDHCGTDLGPYAMEKLDFPLDDLGPEASSTTEKLRAMTNAEYVRICLECPEEPESESEDGGEQR